jgi:AraC-like DNA-binding protein/mannose-6-phosphate isomerase-like protein (cupin superfamily)
MNQMELYEKKIINDKDFPIQIVYNHIRRTGTYCKLHWHEHLEVHYALSGSSVIYAGKKPYEVKEGDLLIINSGELHMAYCKGSFDAIVMIFEMKDFSEEVAVHNVIFQSLISGNDKIREWLTIIYKEEIEKENGYKMAIRGKLYELITYLLRNYVMYTLTPSQNEKRIKHLNQINVVLKYIQEHYVDIITNAQMADIIHLSEGRFIHLFKETMGKSPINYINEVRLDKAHSLLLKGELTVMEVAEVTGFQDYNNFGRLFKNHYGFSPSKVWDNISKKGNI